MNERERYEQGLALRRAVLGDAHVERALAGRSDFTAEWQDLKLRGRPAAEGSDRQDPAHRASSRAALERRVRGGGGFQTGSAESTLQALRPEGSGAPDSRCLAMSFR